MIIIIIKVIKEDTKVTYGISHCYVAAEYELNKTRTGRRDELAVEKLTTI